MAKTDFQNQNNSPELEGVALETSYSFVNSSPYTFSILNAGIEGCSPVLSFKIFLYPSNVYRIHKFC